MFAFGLKRMAERQGLQNAWFAFVPLLQFYLMGQIAQDRVSVVGLPHWLLWGSIANIMLCWVPVLNVFIMIVFYVLLVVTYYHLFDKYSDNAVIFTIFSILFSLQPVFVFMIRNKPERERVVIIDKTN